MAYCDADWAGDISDRRSTSGYVVKYAGAAISWKSVKQNCTALSTVEAEYISAATVAKELTWIQRLFHEIATYPIKGLNLPTTVKIDNNGARELAKNPQASQRTKHIDIRYHYIREVIQEGKIQLEQCPTNEMTADVLTKALPSRRFEECRSEMGVMRVGMFAKLTT